MMKPPVTSTESLRDRVILIEPDTEQIRDLYGELQSNTNQKRYSRWAEVKERTGREMMLSGSLSAIGSATCRLRTDKITRKVTSDWEIEFRGIRWVIRSVMHFQSRDFIELLIEKGV